MSSLPVLALLAVTAAQTGKLDLADPRPVRAAAGRPAL
jgi:hypothetical protein